MPNFNTTENNNNWKIKFYQEAFQGNNLTSGSSTNIIISRIAVTRKNDFYNFISFTNAFTNLEIQNIFIFSWSLFLISQWNLPIFFNLFGFGYFYLKRRLERRNYISSFKYSFFELKNTTIKASQFRLNLKIMALNINGKSK